MGVANLDLIRTFVVSDPPKGVNRVAVDVNVRICSKAAIKRMPYVGSLPRPDWRQYIQGTTPHDGRGPLAFMKFLRVSHDLHRRSNASTHTSRAGDSVGLSSIGRVHVPSIFIGASADSIDLKRKSYVIFAE